MNKIKVISRYNKPRYFEEVDNGYMFSGDFDFIRGGKTNSGGDYIDVDGGPFITVGQELKYTHPDLKGIVKSVEIIKHGYLIKTK